jgi:hypothetical protein
MKNAPAFVAAMLLAFAAPASSQKTPPPKQGTIPPGSAIFVDTNNGFDTFILAAIQNKKVNLHLVSSRESADYILDSSLFHDAVAIATPNYAKSGRTSEAAFKLTAKSGDIVWAYAVSKGIFSNGKQSVAEACAKHLKDIVK